MPAEPMRSDARGIAGARELGLETLHPLSERIAFVARGRELLLDPPPRLDLLLEAGCM
ncbi:MAG: hypothetical protein WB297_08720 [Actinomycetota bacterium]